ncbi:hypothetical protein FKP32DRAFT_691704 [Trametes sanguinea]|nr:hypothetical protein FKP32DRAFT_691704 [Trametes sanguinea]
MMCVFLLLLMLWAYEMLSYSTLVARRQPLRAIWCLHATIWSADRAGGTRLDASTRPTILLPSCDRVHYVCIHGGRHCVQARSSWVLLEGLTTADTNREALKFALSALSKAGTVACRLPQPENIMELYMHSQPCGWSNSASYSTLSGYICAVREVQGDSASTTLRASPS